MLGLPPFGVIEDDYHRVKKDITKKISPLILKFLRQKGIVQAPFYAVYKIVSERVEEIKMNVDRSIIEHVNNKLIWYYENLERFSILF
jgi:hypothetical protein